MKVSVIVPVYNTEKYLERSIDSLLNQTLKELEIVIVDDGSTDRCGRILDEYYRKHPDRIQLIHKENEGQGKARNIALHLCKGEYIGFLDSDDYMDFDAFECMYESAIREDADYVACGYRDTTYQGEKQVILKEYVASKVARKTEDLFFGALASPWLHLYKRDLIIENGIKFPEKLIYEDTAFYLNAIPYIHKISVVEKALANRVRRKASTMTIKSSDKVAQIFPVLQNSIDFYNEKKFMKQYGKQLEYFCVRILLCSSMERIGRVKSIKIGWGLVKETICFIHKNFPDYKKNPFLKGGMTHIYMKSFCMATAWIYYPLFRFKAKLERKYE